MAKLINESSNDWDMQTNENFKEYFERQDNLLKQLEDKANKSKTIKDKIIEFPVADGKALYVVKKIKPLTLAHIPYGDGYSVHPALIRGLTVKDVSEMVEANERIAKLFKSKK